MKMKPSNIEWIGDIPDNWETNTAFQVFTQVKNKNEGLKEQNLLSLSYGKIKRKSIETVGGLLPENFDGYNIIEADDIVLRLTDLQNDQKSLRVGLSPERGIVTSAYLTLRNRSTSLPKYLYYYLHAFDISKGFYGMGAGVRQGLNWDGLKWLKILSPPVPEQERIVNFLDVECARIDAVIEQTRASIEEYKKLKQSVITQAVTKGIRPGRKMKDSGVDWIGEIPEEWDVISIGRLFVFVGGYAFSSEKFCEETNHQVARMGNIKDDCLLLTEKPVFIDDDYARKTQAFLVKAEDILFTMTGTKGKKDYFYTVLVDDTDIRSVKLYINQRVGCFRKNEDCDMRYYNYLLKVPELKNYIFLFETGTANQGNLGIATIRKTRLLFPPLKEQSEIADNLTGQCNMINSTIRKKEALIDELATYKKSLIFEYVTGKKEVAL